MEIVPSATVAAPKRLARLERWLESPRNGLGLILLLAALVRLTAICAFPSLYHADENFQFLEQAHRIAFGYGITPWEMRDGLRSLLLPAIFAKVFLLGDHLGLGPAGYILAAHCLLACLSLVGVAAVFRMGARVSPIHALVAGLVAASWYELVYFSFRPLTEAIATNFLLIALACASERRHEHSKKRLIAIGLCLGICLMLRIHLLPGVAVVLCGIGRLKLRSNWLPLILGMMGPVYVFGLYDQISWGHPFHSYVASVRVNLGENKASNYGVRPVLWYLKDHADLWAGALPILLGFIALRLRRSALWLLAAAVIIAMHSLIPHKESRFVFPAFACLAVVAAMGSADLIQWSRARLGQGSAIPWLAGAALFWLATSASLAFAPGFVENWYRDRQMLQTELFLNQQPELCGVMLYDHHWYETGGYAYLHRPVPMFERGFKPWTLSAQERAEFNYAVLMRKSLPDFAAPFAIDGCFGDGPEDLCVISRPGPCTSEGDLSPLLQEQGLGERAPSP